MAPRARKSSRAVSDPVSPACLPQLPVELIEWTAGYLNARDICHLRLTCSEMQAKTTFHFARTQFSDRAFLLADRSSMICLYQISAHPVFSKSMRRIRFSLATLVDTVDDYYELKKAPSEDLPPRSREERARFRERRREYDELVQAERRFRHDVDLNWLTPIFANFMEVGNTPAIVANDHELFGKTSSNAAPWGYKALCRKLGYEDCLGITDFDRVPVEAIHSAIHMTDFPVTHLDLGYHFAGVPFSMYMMLDQTRWPFKHLKHLKLVLAHSDVSKIKDEDERDEHVEWHHICFMRFICEAEHLESLALSMERAPYDGRPLRSRVVFHNLAGLRFNDMPEPLQHLRELELEGMEIRPADLLEFAAAHKTIQKLKLRQIRDPLDRDARWPEMGRDVREAFGTDAIDLDLKSCYTWSWMEDFHVNDRHLENSGRWWRRWR